MLGIGRLASATSQLQIATYSLLSLRSTPKALKCTTLSADVAIAAGIAASISISDCNVALSSQHMHCQKESNS